MGFFRNKNKIISAVLTLLLAVMPTSFSLADNTTIQQQISQKQQQLQQLNQQITQLQNQIATNEKKQSSLKNEIAIYDEEIQSTQIQVQATQTSIDNTNLQIQQTQDEIQQQTNDLNSNKTILSDLINSLNEQQNSTGLNVLGSANFSDFMDQIQYTQSVQDKVFSLVQQIQDLKAKLVQNQANLQANLSQLNELSQQLQQTQTTLSDERNSKVQLLNQTHGQESSYQKLLATTKTQESDVNKEIYQLDQQVQTKKGFNALQPIHGILAYPVDGVITQGYGNTGFTQLGYNFHNGLDIAGPPGAPVTAAADGTIYAVGTGQAAYGNWVVIKHQITTANGHEIMTLYGHLKTFTVLPGQTVKQGDLIGYEGNTGDTTRLLYGPEHGYHVHFSVFDSVGFGIANGANPQIYGPYQIPYGYSYNPLDFL